MSAKDEDKTNGRASGEPVRDPTKYNGPSGDLPPGSGVPKSEQEVIDGMRIFDEWERRSVEREIAWSEIAKLSHEEIAARDAHDHERADALKQQGLSLVRAMRKKFGY